MRHQQGLCITCDHDSSCSFPRTSPVLYCEEFDVGPERTATRKTGTAGSSTSRRSALVPVAEETVE